MIAVYVARLRELAQVFPRPDYEWEDRPRFDPPVTADTVQALERKVGFPLPVEVREFFTLTDGVIGLSVHNGYRIGGAELIASLIESGGIPREVPDGLTAPIAFDGGGNAFLLSSTGKIWRWDHETNGVSLVTDSFETFLLRVVADWEAYIDETPEWRFLV